MYGFHWWTIRSLYLLGLRHQDTRAGIIVQDECNRACSNCWAAADNVKEKHALRRRFSPTPPSLTKSETSSSYFARFTTETMKCKVKHECSCFIFWIHWLSMSYNKKKKDETKKTKGKIIRSNFVCDIEKMHLMLIVSLNLFRFNCFFVLLHRTNRIDLRN